LNVTFCVPYRTVPNIEAECLPFRYWNQGGLSNVVSMFLYLMDAYRLKPSTVPPDPLVETPPLGCLHPLYRPGEKAYFRTPAEYIKWYEKEGPLRGTGAPVAAVLVSGH